MAELPLPQNPPLTPLDLAAFDRKVDLICKACGKKGKYDVGRICIDPAKIRKPNEESASQEEAVCFSGYFHCRRCGAGGPWEFPPMTRVLLIALMMEAIHNPAKARIHFAQPRLFDGTVAQTAAEGEAHLKKLIASKPDDAFLWSRLGNLYEGAEQHDLALTAFQKAVGLNPQDVESLHSLGCYWMDQKNDAVQAAEYFHQILRHCRTPSRVRPQMLRDIVRDALERLLRLHEESDRTIPFFPPPTAGPANPNETLELRLVSFRLDTEQGWEDLVNSVLSGEPPRSARPPTRPLPFGGGPGLQLPRARERVGRNDPCSCGSGKKFKKCCGQKR